MTSFVLAIALMGGDCVNGQCGRPVATVVRGAGQVVMSPVSMAGKVVGHPVRGVGKFLSKLNPFRGCKKGKCR